MGVGEQGPIQTVYIPITTPRLIPRLPVYGTGRNHLAQS